MASSWTHFVLKWCLYFRTSTLLGFFFFLLYQVLVAARGIFIATCGIFGEARRIFSCSKWDLVPWPGIKPPALGVLATGPPGKSLDPPLLSFWLPAWGCWALAISGSWGVFTEQSRQDDTPGWLWGAAAWGYLAWERGLGGCSWQLPKPSLLGILPVSPLLGSDCQCTLLLRGTETCIWTSWRVPRPGKSTSMHPGCLLFWAPSALWAFCQLLLMCVYHWEPFVCTDCYLGILSFGSDVCLGAPTCHVFMEQDSGLGSSSSRSSPVS